MNCLAAALLLASAALLPAAPALAGPSFTVTAASVTGDAVTITGPVSAQTTAGPITLTTTMGTLIAWCVDLYHEIQTKSGQSLAYQIGTVTTNGAATPATLTAAQQTTIGQLAQYGESLIGTASATNDKLAAVQLAIWQTEYPSFTYTGAAGASVSGALSAAASFSSTDVGLIALNGTQTFVTASKAALAADPVKVPEPAGLLLLALAIPATILARRRATLA